MNPLNQHETGFFLINGCEVVNSEVYETIEHKNHSRVNISHYFITGYMAVIGQ